MDRQARRQDHLRYQQRKTAASSQIIASKYDGLQAIRLRMYRHPHSAPPQRQFLLLDAEDLQVAQDDLRAGLNDKFILIWGQSSVQRLSARNGARGSGKTRLGIAVLGGGGPCAIVGLGPWLINITFRGLESTSTVSTSSPSTGATAGETKHQSSLPASLERYAEAKAARGSTQPMSSWSTSHFGSLKYKTSLSPTRSSYCWSHSKASSNFTSTPDTSAFPKT